MPQQLETLLYQNPKQIFMIATYVARVTLKTEGDLSRVEELLATESFSQPHLYATSTPTPLVMLVSPYKDNQGREVRSFELTDYLVGSGLLSENPDGRGPVTQEMVDALLKKLEGKSPRIELYRVSATDVEFGGYRFFNSIPYLQERGPGPLFPFSLEPDIRPIVVTKNHYQLFKPD